MLTFRDTGKGFELEGDLLIMITNKNYNVDLASLPDKKFSYDFAKEMNFDVRDQGWKSTQDRALISLRKSPAIMASGVSNTTILPPDLDEICETLTLLPQENHGGNNSKIFNEEILSIVDKLLDYKCLSEKQHKQILNKSYLLHE